MADEYIKRKDAIDYIEDFVRMNKYYHPYSKRTPIPIAEVIARINETPSADVQPVVRKPVEGYEGLYWVTSTGEVTNADGKVMKQYVKKGHATYYKKVALYKDGEYKQLYVHRIVAKAFIPNPNNYPQVNHRDEDGTNNNAYNLEWCTHKYNVNYGTAKEGGKKRF